MRTLGVALLVAALTQAAHAGCRVDEPSYGLFDTRDETRIARLYESRSKGLVTAMAEPDAEIRKRVAVLVDDAREHPAVFEQARILEGAFTCTVTKLGREIPVTTYAPFACTITRAGDNYRFAKTAGSQRFTGTLVSSGTGYLYAGAGNYEGEQPLAYGANPERNQAGCLTARADGSFVLELPMPVFDSHHDLIVLRAE